MPRELKRCPVKSCDFVDKSGDYHTCPNHKQRVILVEHRTHELTDFIGG